MELASPSDTVDVRRGCTGIYYNGTGANTLRIETAAGDICNLTLSGGERFNVRIKRVHASGTSASNLFIYGYTNA